MSLFRRRLLMYLTLNRIPKPIASYRCYDKTNDDTDRDVLKDLTGNGHDIQLYNFAFTESSGYGKYGFDLSKLEVIDSSVYDGSLVSHENNTIKFYGTFGELSRCGVRLNHVSIGTKKFKFKCTNIPDGKVVDIQIKNGIGSSSTNKTLRNGINTFDFDFNANDVRYFIIYYTGGVSGTSIDITIEQIPDYQGALVSDVVDDYGLCNNFPILTKEKGYTIIALRSWILKNGANQILVSDNKDTTIAEYIIVNENAIAHVYTRVFSSSTPVKNYFKNDSIVVCSSSRYNDLKLTNIGDTPTNPELRIFKHASVALYALEIYDRDLTDEEIAKVKERMIAEYEEKTGEKYPIEYPGLIAAWSAEGKTNDDEDRDILRDLTGNGHDITLNNFAFNSEGSGYGHPDYPDALVFDGVDDYGVCENIQVLTDYTIISKRFFGEKSNSCFIGISSKIITPFVLFENYTNDGTFTVCSKGLSSVINKGIEQGYTSYIKTNYYNNNYINIGNITESGSSLYIGHGVDYATTRYWQGAFYSTYIFDRSLDEQEIKSFIRKYIDPNYTLPSEQQS